MRKGSAIPELGFSPGLKYAVLVADGMADHPVKELGGRTPLEVARTPALDTIAARGIVGTIQTIPRGLPSSSDVAMLGLLGYDVEQCYPGRGPLEAASMGVELAEDEVAFRCNLVTVENEVLSDYSAGHVSSKEARVLIGSLNEKLGARGVRFHAGVSYRHLAVISRPESVQAQCMAPHDITGQPLEGNLPRGKEADFLRSLMDESGAILDSHEVNMIRRDLGENPANMIWLWGQGTSPEILSFKDCFGIEGSVISAVDVVKGIGATVGLRVVDVPGATGYFDTDYSAKAEHGIRELEKLAFVLIHVEAPDEAGHIGDQRKKIQAIEEYDAKIVAPVLEFLEKRDGHRVMVLPDHATPIAVRTHTREPVPFAIAGAGVETDEVLSFSEAAARGGAVHLRRGHDLMPFFLGKSSG